MSRRLAARAIPAAFAVAIAALSLCLPVAHADTPAPAKTGAPGKARRNDREGHLREGDPSQRPGRDLRPAEDRPGRARAGALPRRQPRRAAGPAGVRPHVRAHDVPRLGPRAAGGAHEADRRRRRRLQRVHQLRPDDVRQHACRATTSRWRSTSRPTAWRASRCRTTSSRPSGRSSARNGGCGRPTRRWGTLYQDFLRTAFKAHSYRWTPIGDMDQLRQAKSSELQEFFNTLLRAEQRLPGDRRRHRHPADEAVGPEVLRLDPQGPGDRPRDPQGARADRGPPAGRLQAERAARRQW